MGSGFGEEIWLFRYRNIPVMRAPTIAAMMAPIAVILAALMVTPVAFLALRRGLGGSATGTSCGVGSRQLEFPVYK